MGIYLDWWGIPLPLLLAISFVFPYASGFGNLALSDFGVRDYDFGWFMVTYLE